jgi:hypothetical protein
MSKKEKTVPVELEKTDALVKKIVRIMSWYFGISISALIFVPLFEGVDLLVAFLYWTGLFLFLVVTIFELFVDIHGPFFLGLVARLTGVRGPNKA